MELLAEDNPQKKKRNNSRRREINMEYNRICVLDTETTDRY